MKKVLFVELPHCGTCRKAKKLLEEKGVHVEARHIVEQPPTKEELKQWISLSGMDIKKFFNTSGMKYRELGLKDKLKTADEEEMLDLLASDGMLVKRPIVTDGKRVTVGFKEQEYDQWISR